MSKDRNELRAGIFIVVAILLSVGIVIGIKGTSALLRPKRHVTVQFKLTDDIGGLAVGDEVRLGGHKVGAVTRIQVVEGAEEPAPPDPATGKASPDDGTRIYVTFTLPTEYTLREDARVGVQAGLLPGNVALNIERLGRGAEVDEYAVLTGQPSTFSSVLTALGETAPELAPIFRDIRGKILPKVEGAVKTYGEAGAHIRDLLGDSKTDLRTTIKNIKDVTGTAKEKLPATLDSANKLLAKLNETVESAKGTLENITAATADAKQITGAVRQVVVGNKGKLDGMIASLKTAADNIKHATADLRRNPWRLLYRPGKAELANLALYDSARQFAEGAGALNDAALALRDALQDEDASPEQVRALLQRLDQTFERFGEVEDRLWTSVREE